MLLARLTLLLCVLTMTLGQRVTVEVGPGTLNVFVVAFVGAALLLELRDGLVGAMPKPFKAVGINTVGPLFALLLFLPFIGVAIGRYGLSSLYAWITVLLPLAVLSLGRAARRHRLRLERAGFVAILVQGIYGAGQTLNRLGIVPDSVWSSASQWDAESQLAANEKYLISGRSVGLFLNANQFGLWSCLAVVFSATALTGRARAIGLMLGIFGVVGSQSRTSWATLGVLALILLFKSMRDRKVGGRVVAWMIVLTPVLLLAWLFGLLGRLVETTLLDRLNSGLTATQDENLAARMESWKAAIDFANQYAIGTLGPPQVLYGNFIDNQYVAFYLQGGVVLVAAFLVALLSPRILRRRGVPLAGAVGVATVVVAIASLTMQPVDAPVSMLLLWLLAAAGFSRAGDQAGTQSRTGARMSPVGPAM